MKAEDLFEAIGTSNSDFLEHSERLVKPKNKRIIIKWCGVAACLCIIVAAAFSTGHFKKVQPVPNDDLPAQAWTITYNKTEALADTAKEYQPGAFTENLSKEELSSVGPGTGFKWMDCSGYGEFDNTGSLIRTVIDITNSEWNGKTNVILQKGEVVKDYNLQGEPVISYYNGTEVTAYEYHAESYVLLELSFTMDDIGFLITADTLPENISKAKSDIYDILSCYITERSIDLDVVKASYIPEWKDEALTSAEALKDVDFGTYMPPAVPNGFSPESIRRYMDQKNNFLSGLWTYGYDELRWKISYLGDGDKERISSTKDKKNYDLTLYPIPRAESVPEKLRKIVDNPIFNISELTLDVVKARAYTLNDSGDSTGCRMHFSVLYGNILIDVSSKGISPEWIYTQLTGMPH